MKSPFWLRKEKGMTTRKERRKIRSRLDLMILINPAAAPPRMRQGQARDAARCTRPPVPLPDHAILAQDPLCHPRLEH